MRHKIYPTLPAKTGRVSRTNAFYLQQRNRRRRNQTASSPEHELADQDGFVLVDQDAAQLIDQS